MAQPTAKGGTLAARLREAVRDLVRVSARIDGLNDQVSAVAQSLREVADTLVADGDPDAGAVRRTQMERRVLREEAAAGAMSVAMKLAVDGSALVRIDGGKAFRLQPGAAALLALLRRPGSDGSSDDLIAWHSFEDVAKALGKDPCAPQSRHAVAQAIYKLRVALRDAGQNWFFVQTDRRGRVRFALRKELA
jgi:hypothetical protein